LHNLPYRPVYAFSAVSVGWLSVFAVAIWQIVGIWRSADRYIQARKFQGRRAPWGGVAKLLMIFGVLQLRLATAQFVAPQITGFYRIAFLDDPDVPAFAINVLGSGAEVEVLGGFKYGISNDLSAVLDARPIVTTIRLNSPGGRIGEALAVHDEIKKRGLDTYVSDQCDSACPFAFVGGKRRWTSEGAKIGFHAGTFPGIEEMDTSDEVRILRSAGISEDFIARAMNTPSEGMWYPDVDELMKANVVTDLATSDQFVASPEQGPE
jgi:hypothetical protein